MLRERRVWKDRTAYSNLWRKPFDRQQYLVILFSRIFNTSNQGDIFQQNFDPTMYSLCKISLTAQFKQLHFGFNFRQNLHTYFRILCLYISYYNLSYCYGY